MTIIFSISFIALKGQSYDTRIIINKADSILRYTVNDSIYQYFKFDSGSYYDYSGFFRKCDFKKDYVGFLNGWGVKRLIQTNRTKGKFKNTDVRFHFEYPQIRGVRGMTFVKLDKNLDLVEPLYLDFIPDFIKENRDCDFMSNDTALRIAKDSLKKKGLYEIKPYLSYDFYRKRYTYEIDNILTEMKDVYGNNTGNMEVLIIDAITKTILYHDINWYGPIY